MEVDADKRCQTDLVQTHLVCKALLCAFFRCDCRPIQVEEDECTMVSNDASALQINGKQLLLCESEAQDDTLPLPASLINCMLCEHELHTISMTSSSSCVKRSTICYNLQHPWPTDCCISMRILMQKGADPLKSCHRFQDQTTPLHA